MLLIIIMRKLTHMCHQGTWRVLTLWQQEHPPSHFCAQKENIVESNVLL